MDIKKIYISADIFFIIGIPNAKDRMIEAGCVDSGCKLWEKLDVITMPGAPSGGGRLYIIRYWQ